MTARIVAIRLRQRTLGRELVENPRPARTASLDPAAAGRERSPRAADANCPVQRDPSADLRAHEILRLAQLPDAAGLGLGPLAHPVGYGTHQAPQVVPEAPTLLEEHRDGFHDEPQRVVL